MFACFCVSVCLSLSLFLCLSLHLSASVLLSSIESKIKSAGLTFQAKGDYGYSLSASSLWLPWATMERYVFQTNPTMLAKSTCMGTGISRKLRHCAGTHSSQFLRSNKVADMSVSLVGRWHAGINTDTHRHTHTQTDRQTDRQTDTHTDMHVYATVDTTPSRKWVALTSGWSVAFPLELRVQLHAYALQW